MRLTFRAHLVPVLSFGENEVYMQVPNPRGSLLRKLQTNMMHLISFAPPIFYGWKGTIVPFKKPINTVGQYTFHTFFRIIGKTSHSYFAETDLISIYFQLWLINVQKSQCRIELSKFWRLFRKKMKRLKHRCWSDFALLSRQTLFVHNCFFFMALLVGTPIPVNKVEEPSWSEVCELHEKYKQSLRDLFEKYKGQFGYSEDYKLEIIWTNSCTKTKLNIQVILPIFHISSKFRGGKRTPRSIRSHFHPNGPLWYYYSTSTFGQLTQNFFLEKFQCHYMLILRERCAPGNARFWSKLLRNCPKNSGFGLFFEKFVSGAKKGIYKVMGEQFLST